MLYVITSYRVSQNNPSSCGSETYYMQQWQQLQLDGTEQPNPRQRTLQALKEFILPLIHDNHEIIVMIDANSSHLDPIVDTFLHQTNLHDITTEYLPDQPPPTYQRGQHKIDHIWGTPGILTATVGAGILPYGTGPKSDHTILYCDISMAILSGLSTQSIHDPTHPASHNLWSTDIKAANKYIELVTHGFQAANISQ